MATIGVTFEVKKRTNAFVPKGEWVLQGKHGEERPWVFYTWKKEPSDKEIVVIHDLIERSFEFYHLVIIQSLRKIRS